MPSVRRELVPELGEVPPRVTSGHWQLDVSFGQDAARNRKDNGPANIAVIRRRALDVARLDKSKGSLTQKLKRAGWNDDFMLQLLNQMR